MRKNKIIAFVMAAAALLSSCGKDNDPAEADETETPANMSDYEVHDDYKNITYSGEHDVRVMFVNVGKADSIIIEIDGRLFMIDTGTSESVPYTYAALDLFEEESITGLFITHPDRDHIGGYPYIRERMTVENTYAPAICKDMYVIDRAATDDNLTKLEPGQVVEAGDGVWFEVLGPIRYNPFDDNDNSLVLKLVVNGKSMLFCGDMKEQEEKNLLDAGYELDCDILKVGYHGRDEASTPDFVAAVSPEYSVISTSRDEEKDTADEAVIGRLEEVGSEVFVTDEYSLGIMITVTPDGITLEDVTCGDAEYDKIKLDKVSKTDQTATLINEGKTDADISGWWITSDRGGEVYRFPEGTVVPAGGKLVLVCRGSNAQGDLIWGESKVWHESKSDMASLIDNFGNLIDTKKSK